MEQFEENIKEKLNQRKIQPSPQAWDKLEMMLSEQETQSVNKKSLRTYLFIAASLLAFVSLGTFFFKMNVIGHSTNKTVVPVDQKISVTEDIATQDNSQHQEITQPKKELNQTKIIPSKKENLLLAENSEINTVLENKDAGLEEDLPNKTVIESNKIIAELQSDVETEKSEIRVDPKKLLMVAEYERNVEKSASQFKQMKEKFQEVKTALNNINQ